MCLQEATHGALANNSDFPSLGEAVKQAPKPKPKKGTKMALGDFLGASAKAPAFEDKGLQDKQILMSLPTAPRGGPREEGEGRPTGGLGGGFRDYGGDREGRGECRGNHGKLFRGRAGRPLPGSREHMPLPRRPAPLRRAHPRALAHR